METPQHEIRIVQVEDSTMPEPPTEESTKLHYEPLHSASPRGTKRSIVAGAGKFFGELHSNPAGPTGRMLQTSRKFSSAAVSRDFCSGREVVGRRQCFRLHSTRQDLDIDKNPMIEFSDVELAEIPYIVPFLPIFVEQRW